MAGDVEELGETSGAGWECEQPGEKFKCRLKGRSREIASFLHKGAAVDVPLRPGSQRRSSVGSHRPGLVAPR